MRYEKITDSLVSIVIPVYNAADYIEESYRSVIKQTYDNWELIFVDDASTDRSRIIIEKLISESNKYLKKSKIKAVFLETNQGPAAARNAGIREASGRYLAYLDADDLWKQEKLEKQLAFMQKEGYAFAFTGYEYADHNGIGTGKRVRVPNRISYQEALRNTTISTITVMFDRTKIPEQLLYMPEDATREDTATWWKILGDGYDAYGLDEVLSIYRRHKGSHSSNKWHAVRGTWKLYRKSKGMSFLLALRYFIQYIWHAVVRRV